MATLFGGPSSRDAELVKSFGRTVRTDWRIPRQKTVSLGIILALNIGVDPPDVLKPPVNQLEAWIDPSLAPAPVSAENIAKALQNQYEQWQPRSRVRVVVKPTSEDLRRLCLTLRRHAKADRVLIHYNGHGVPLPTLNGELWVFDKKFTQYIPLSIFDLQNFVGGPAMYVFDCSGAGRAVYWYQRFIELREENGETSTEALRDAVLFASCGPHELLPSHPSIPADLFTCCLTTPIKTSLRWHCMTSYLFSDAAATELVDKLSGSVAMRKTPLGELNWIFTAITDAIAFDVLPTDLFLRLFRQDVLVASMFRNFLLASRVMRSSNCTPVSVPALPDCRSHHLWDAWDLVVDEVLQRLRAPQQQEQQQQQQQLHHSGFGVNSGMSSPGASMSAASSSMNAAVVSDYTPSTFFQDQMQELRSWLVTAAGAGGIVLGGGGAGSSGLGAHNGASLSLAAAAQLGMPRKAPEQLPIVLQVMLSQSQRKEALDLVAEFVSTFGDWAVNAVLGVDLFPYLSKLLRSNNAELRWPLVVIWHRILCCDLTARQELILEKGYRCFLNILQSKGNDSRELCLSLFVLALTCWRNREAQQSCLKHKLVQLAMGLFDHDHAEVRQWATLSLAALLSGKFSEAKVQGAQLKVQEKLCLLLSDAVPQVRASAAYCIGMFLRTTLPDLVTIELNLSLTLREVTSPRDSPEASSVVRSQVAIALVGFARAREKYFPAAGQPEGLSEEELQYRRVCKAIWKHLQFLQTDPHPDVSRPIAELMAEAQQLQQHPTLQQQPTSSAPSSGGISGGSNSNFSTISSGSSSSIGVPASLAPAASQAGDDEDDEDALVPDDFFGTSCALFHRSSSSILSEESRLDASWRASCVAQQERQASAYVTSRHAKFRSKIGVVAMTQTPSCLAWNAMDDTLIVGAASGPKQISLCSGPAISKIRSSFGIGEGGVSCFQWMDQELLLEGTVDTSVHVYRLRDEQLVAAWRPFVPAVGNRSPVICGWSETHGHLYTSGNVPFIRVWDVKRQYAIQDIETGVNAGVTRLWSDSFSGNNNFIIGGFASGALKVFDPRAGSEATKDLLGFSTCVMGLHVPVSSPNTVVAISRDGKVNTWDPRSGSTPMRSFATKAKSDVSAFALHNVAPILACGFLEQQIHLYNLNGDQLRVIRYHEGFLEERIGPISGLAFHPNKLVLAAASTDKYVSVWSE